MQRPLLMRLAPIGLRPRLYYHLYRHRREAFGPLHESASLHYAPAMRMGLLATDEGHSCIALTGVYELDLTRRMVRAARAGGVLVDVGANYGYFSLLWAAQRADNQVVAFEASPRNHAHLIENLQRNRVSKQVDLWQIALGERAGRLEFDLGPAEQSGWGGFAAQPSASTQAVDVVRLDVHWTRSEDIAVLKVDVEGADTWVLRGAEGLLKAQRIREVYFEQNRPRMQALNISTAEAGTFLRDMGYEVEALSDPSRELVEFCARPRARPRPAR